MLHRFTRRKCSRCGGNICISLDYYLEGSLINWYEQENCLQCGRIIYKPESWLKTKVTTGADSSTESDLQIGA